MSHLLRTRFKDEIVAEFIVVEGSTKVIILASGMPGYPANEGTVRFLASKGYSVINPRYRGSWESSGIMFEDSPHRDILDIVEALNCSFVDSWGGEEYKIQAKEIYVIGSSFGGAAALLCSMDPHINKVIAISPVVDWTAPSKDESLDFLEGFIERGFGEGYRIDMDGWSKLSSGNLYNPVSHVTDIVGDKVLIVHSEEDEVVMPGPVAKFADDTNSRIIMLKRGGHFGLGKIRSWRMWRKIKKFLNQ